MTAVRVRESVLSPGFLVCPVPGCCGRYRTGGHCPLCADEDTTVVDRYVQLMSDEPHRKN